MAPRINTKGTIQVASSLDEALVTEFRAWLAARPAGESLRDHLEMAIRRHMDAPPPPFKPEAPPLPPVGGGKKGKGRK